jgi:hypothetical protein
MIVGNRGEMKMRSLTLFTATLAMVLGMSLTAQAATLTMTTDKSVYTISEIITITVIGTPIVVNPKDKDDAIGGFIYDLAGVTSQILGGKTQSAFTYNTVYGTQPWLQSPLNIVPNLSFNQLSPVGSKAASSNLTAIMTFHASTSGIATFEWLTSGFDALDFFGVTAALGTSVTIVPEPTTAGLMGLGLIGLAISGRRRKS